MKTLNHNTRLFIFAIGIAIVLWMFMALNQTHNDTLRIPITYHGLTSAQAQSSLPIAVSVQLEGKGIELIRARFNGLQADYEIPKSRADVSEISLSDLKLNLPAELAIISLEPIPGLRMQSKQSLTTREIPIELSFSSKKVNDEFNRMGYRTSINSVKISGNRSSVHSIRAIFTEKIDKRHLEGRKDFYVKLILPATDLTLSRDSIKILAQDINVTTKILTNVPVIAKDKISFYPSSVAVRLSSSSERLQSIKTNDIQVMLDLANKNNGIIPLKVILPPDYELVDFTPRFVTYKR
jgi:YbbR domain-containing protein